MKSASGLPDGQAFRNGALSTAHFARSILTQKKTAAGKPVKIPLILFLDPMVPTMTSAFRVFSGEGFEKIHYQRSCSAQQQAETRLY